VRLPTIQTPVPFFVMGIAAVLVPMMALVWKAFGPTMLINETPSEPVGFYRLVRHDSGDYRRGMYVVFPVPDDLRAIVYGRHWMRNGIPFLKELIGLEGDQVCIFSDRLEVNGRTVGPVFRVDSVGFPLPQHPGCFVIPKGNFFAASQYLDKSFDGRYFGALPLNIVEGEAKPVWTF
jgi:conjugative transfer signal peptidase TraF